MEKSHEMANVKNNFGPAVNGTMSLKKRKRRCYQIKHNLCIEFNVYLSQFENNIIFY